MSGGGEDKIQGFAEHLVDLQLSILSISPNEFNKFNNTGAQMQDSIYHMTLKSHLISQ